MKELILRTYADGTINIRERVHIAVGGISLCQWVLRTDRFRKPIDDNEENRQKYATNLCCNCLQKERKAGKKPQLSAKEKRFLLEKEKLNRWIQGK